MILMAFLKTGDFKVFTRYIYKSQITHYLVQYVFLVLFFFFLISNIFSVASDWRSE